MTLPKLSSSDFNIVSLPLLFYLCLCLCLSVCLCPWLPCLPHPPVHSFQLTCLPHPISLTPEAPGGGEGSRPSGGGGARAGRGGGPGAWGPGAVTDAGAGGGAGGAGGAGAAEPGAAGRAGGAAQQQGWRRQEREQPPVRGHTRGNTSTRDAGAHVHTCVLSHTRGEGNQRQSPTFTYQTYVFVHTHRTGGESAKQTRADNTHRKWGEPVVTVRVHGHRTGESSSRHMCSHTEHESCLQNIRVHRCVHGTWGGSSIKHACSCVHTECENHSPCVYVTQRERKWRQFSTTYSLRRAPQTWVCTRTYMHIHTCTHATRTLYTSHTYIPHTHTHTVKTPRLATPQLHWAHTGSPTRSPSSPNSYVPPGPVRGSRRPVPSPPSPSQYPSLPGFWKVWHTLHTILFSCAQ